MKDKPVKYVVVPVALRADGKVDMSLGRSPYGYHHILKVYKDGSFWLEATIFSDENLGKAEKIAQLLSGATKMEIDPLFYKRMGR